MRAILFATITGKRCVTSKRNQRVTHAFRRALVTFLRSFTSNGATQSGRQKVLLKTHCNEREMCYYRDRSGKFLKRPTEPFFVHRPESKFSRADHRQTGFW